MMLTSLLRDILMLLTILIPTKKFVLFHPFLLFSQFLFLSSKGGQKRWLLTFSLHCSCSFTSHYSFPPPPRLLIDFKNSKWLTYFCILLCICYCFSHLIGLLSVMWLSLLYEFNLFRFIYFLFLSDEGPMLETLDYTIRIGCRLTFLYFDTPDCFLLL